MQAVFGFFGSLVALVATVIAASTGITFFIVLWKSGSLPATVEAFGGFFTMVGAAVAGFFGFLRDLLTFAQS